MTISTLDYPPGVPRQIDADSYTSLVHMLDESLLRYSNQTAFASFDRTMTFSELDNLTRSLSAYLQQEFNIQKGDRVAIMAPNILQYPVAVLAIIRCGAIVVNVNPVYTARELERQLNDSGTTVIIVYSRSEPTLARVIAKTSVSRVIVTWLDDLLRTDGRLTDNDEVSVDHVEFRTAIEAGSKHIFMPIDIDPEDVLLLQYTGGTTGVSKGASLTHRNLIANILQYTSWFANKLEPGSDVILTALPLYHIFALMVNCLSAIRLGMLSVLIAEPRDLTSLVAAFEKWHFTTMTGVNTLFNGLLHTQGFSDIEFRLKLCIGGGTAVQRAVAEPWHKVTGCHILEAYGLSETSPALIANRADSEQFTGSVGLALPSTEISLRSDDCIQVLAGQEGELCVRGPQVMRGYWRNDDATAECMTPDGYFRTGDIATVDELGRFRIVDRKKDMILVSGFNVYPNEIEEVVSRYDGVVEAACIGVPDPKTGEAVRVYVVCDLGRDLSANDITKFCRTELTAYKVPKQIVFVNSLPKSNVGKILRRELRKRVGDHFQNVENISTY